MKQQNSLIVFMLYAWNVLKITLLSLIALTSLFAGCICTFGTHSTLGIQMIAWLVTIFSVIVCGMAAFRCIGDLSEGRYDSGYLADIGEQMMFAGVMVFLLGILLGGFGVSHWISSPAGVFVLSLSGLVLAHYGLLLHCVEGKKSANNPTFLGL